jgi:hypothetical protein
MRSTGSTSVERTTSFRTVSRAADDRSCPFSILHFRIQWQLFTTASMGGALGKAFVMLHSVAVAGLGQAVLTSKERTTILRTVSSTADVCSLEETFSCLIALP